MSLYLVNFVFFSRGELGKGFVHYCTSGTDWTVGTVSFGIDDVRKEMGLHLGNEGISFLDKVDNLSIGKFHQNLIDSIFCFNFIELFYQGNG